MSHKNEEEPKIRSFSWLRVVRMVGVAMLVVVPTLFLLEKNGLLGTQQQCTAAPGGSGRRATSQFDLSNLTVPKSEIRSGGPPKDGIPALSQPRSLAAKSADYLAAEDRVIGVSIGNAARAYPLRILNYHEIVNDQLGGQPLAVTYCPLCDSAAVFDRKTPLGLREFDVSGLLYNSNVLMYDRHDQQESLWSQLRTEALAGPQVRNQLKLLPLELTTWSDWQSRYPATTVLSTETGHSRNYSRSPYDDYFLSPQLMFPVHPTSDRLATKEKILGVLSANKARVYTRSAFNEQKRRIEDRIDGKRLVIEYNPIADSLRVLEAEEGVTWMYSLWFSWYAMHPETEIFGFESLNP